MTQYVGSGSGTPVRGHNVNLADLILDGLFSQSLWIFCQFLAALAAKSLKLEVELKFAAALVAALIRTLKSYVIKGD